MALYPTLNRRRWPRSAALLVMVLAAVLVAGLFGCGRTDRLSQARTLMERQDRAAALVIVKALLQEKPNLGEARVLLGQLLLEIGDPLAAEAELRRALELKLPPAQVLPLLARAMLASNQPAKLLQQWGNTGLTDAAAHAQLKTTVAEAEAITGQLDAARTSLDNALRAAPGHAPALLMQARLAAASGNLAGGRAQVEAVLAAHPDNADAWVLKGDMLVRQRAEPAEAEQAYRQALAVRPEQVSAHTALIALALARRDLVAASSLHEAMRKAVPRHPQTLLFAGQLALLRGDLAKARETFQLLLRAMPRNLMLLQSAATVEMRLNAPGQAEVLLAKALQLAPDNPNSRRLAARVALALGQPARAVALLEPLVQGDASDAEAITLTAQAKLLSGDSKAAAALFDRAAKLRPDDPKVRTALALSQLQRGQTDAALVELQRVAADDKGTTADMALIAAQVQRRAFPGALQAIDRLAGKLPDQPLSDHLRGQVLVAQGDVPAARHAFAQALVKDAGYFPTVAALAGLDLQDKQPEAAQARFDALLKRNPKNAQVHLALAELVARSGAGRAAVAGRLEEGIKASPDDISLRLVLVDHHLATANPAAAQAAAQAALAQLPDQPELLARLGQAQLQQGQWQQAVTSFSQLATLQPRSPVAPLGLAEAQLASNDLGAAGRSLKRVLALEPDHVAGQRLAINLALRQKRPDEALAVARQMQQQRPALAIGHLLQAEVHIAQQQWPQAVAALRVAMAKADPQQAPARLHHALGAAGQVAEADALAVSWSKGHPGDLLFQFYLGDVALGQKRWADAEARYRGVLQANPEHALSLNNVAWLMLQQKKPGALGFAERAVKASPDRPALRDTLAQALAADNQLPKALEMQKSALALRPDDPNLRLNLARLYAQANEKKLAKTELDRLAVLGSRFAHQAEVEALARSLGGRP